jgi:hypothetical protein
MRILISVLTILLISTAAYAECECQCVNGQMQSMCSNTTDIPRICPPSICPMTPPSVTPIMPPMVAPPGATRCHSDQIYNPVTGMYEWRSACD